MFTVRTKKNLKERSKSSEGRVATFDSTEPEKELTVGIAQPTWDNLLTVNDTPSASFRISDRFSSDVELIKRALLERGIISSEELDE